MARNNDANVVACSTRKACNSHLRNANTRTVLVQLAKRGCAVHVQSVDFITEDEQN